MTCSNCFSGCSEITSDKCVKYTGVDIPALGIENGDSLCEVEQALANYLATALDGTGIKPVLDITICNLVDQYLPDVGDITIVDLISALIQAACDLQTQVDAVVADVAIIEADYTIDCLAGVTAGSGTHDILQAVITNLCSLNSTMTALINALPNTYVAIADLDQLIQAYLDQINPITFQRTRMVPWVAYEYYGATTGFDSTGAGVVGTQWEDVYLCNGANGTPDKRGRVAVGATNTPGNLPLDIYVDPANPLNPAYIATPGTWTKTGTNGIVLNSTQMPIHTHTPNIVLTNPTHTHFTTLDSEPSVTLTSAVPIKRDNEYPGNSNFSYSLIGVSGIPTIGITSPTSANVSVGSQTNSDAGGGLSHPNYQPAIACYYIMYIP